MLGAREKSKVVTGTPSYALAWTFPDPMHLCALDAGRWPLELVAEAGCRALEQWIWALELGTWHVSWELGTGAGHFS